MTYTVNRISLFTSNIARNKGGTLLGIVAGLLVGLAVALAVAIYVTKVPVPFVQKVTATTAPKPEEEAKKNSTWDPNAPLYGKNPAGTKPVDVPSDNASAPTLPGATGGTTAAANNASPKTDKSKLPPSVTGSDDPIGQIAKATQATQTAKPSATTAAKPADVTATKPGVDPWIYFLQAGAYRDESQADAQRAKLALMGLEAKVTEREQSGAPMYRVRMGPYNTLDEVTAAKNKLESQGIEGATVRVPRP